MPRPKQPKTQRPLPVRLAVIDNQGKFRALVENYSDALAVFANLNLDKLEGNKYRRAELEHLMMTELWEVQKLTKPLWPVTDGKDLIWENRHEVPPDNAKPPGVEQGFIVWLPPEQEQQP